MADDRALTRESARERIVRKGSRWRRRSDGREVTVAFRRTTMNGDNPWRLVAYLFDRDSGGLMHEEDFREDFEWVAGR